MCGIIGAVAKTDVAQLLVDGLTRLEYRGYDSAGIAILDNHHHLQRLRTLGKVSKLATLLKKKPMRGETGIAHTRWATHGKPSERNAHPHIAADEIALVHNGIIENHGLLRAQLIQKGCILTSETDSELVAHLVYLKIQTTHDFLSAVQMAREELKGAYAFGFIYKKEPGRLIAMRSGSPLVIGIGVGEHFIASDALALLPLTRQFIYLEEGDIADIQCNRLTIYDKTNAKVNRSLHTLDNNLTSAIKGDYQHFMLKEIFEQPDAILSTLEGRITYERVLVEAFGVDARELFKQIKRVEIVACGTSYHAGLVGKYWIEELAGIPCQVEIASENRYRHKIIEPHTLFVTLSQSGETADTLAALQLAKQSKYAATLTICNVPDSSLVRESDFVFMMNAGPEIGVASTKSFTCQLVALLLLSISIGRYHHLDESVETNIVKQLIALPMKLTQTLALSSDIKNLAKDFIAKTNALFLGRGIEFPIAMEGALKLKEISYIHAEAYPAGELKHGPLALVDANMPVVALVQNDTLLEKIKSNLEEVYTRDGHLIIFADEKIAFENNVGAIISIPTIDKILAPIVFVIPLQLLAYYVAVLKGTDVDQPRNLAKSVTVE